jgi:hypothetical protein
MIYILTLSVPASTDRTAPLEETLKLTAGNITKVGVEFPPGCAWLVGVRVLEKDRILYPSSPDDWLVSDGQLLQWSDNYPLVDAPFEVVIRAYNDDPYYAHTLRLYFEVMVAQEAVTIPETATSTSGYMGF